MEYLIKKILLLLSNGFEILEASAFIDVMGWNLEEGDKSTKLCSCGLRNEIESSFGQKFIVDYIKQNNSLELISNNEYKLYEKVYKF